MKKILYLLPLCIALLVTVAFASGNIFPDLPESHWAYSDVEIMHRDGRVNGFPDGEFKPNELVTRWQFAKMAGGNPDAVTEGDRPSTRDEAIEYLWTMAGKPEALAPSSVTKGSNEKGAVAWGYTKGIMQGDDGLNLRLESTLTRAEAAALIIRSEQPNLTDVDFKNTVDEVILKRVWDNMRTGLEYKGSNGLTNGYMARLALRIANGGKEPTYQQLTQEPDFSGTYAKDLQLVCQECLGIERATEEFMKAPVNMQDAMAMLSFYTMKQAADNLKYSDEYIYSDATLDTVYGKMALRFARYNEIFLYSEDKLNAAAVASMKDIACMLLQLDEVVGFSRSYGDVHSTRFLKEVYAYPENSADYAYILDEIPYQVYETPIIDGVKPVDSYRFAVTFADTFSIFLKDIAAMAPESVKLKWTMYPSLVAVSDKDMVIRAKLVIEKNPENLTLNQILPNNSFTQTYTGSSFVVDVSTGTPVIDVTMDADKYKAVRAFAGKE